MVLQLDPASSVPLYRQIRDQLRQMIAKGALPRGERLPPTRELATRLKVHRTTVANAYAELEADGLIAGHVGRGTFVAQGVEPPEATAREPFTATLDNQYLWTLLFADVPAEDPLDRLVAECHGNGSGNCNGEISFTLARPPAELYPVEEFRRCCSVVLKRDGHELLQLGCSKGYAPLREYLVGELRNEGINIDMQELLITNGCQQALDLIAKVFVRPGDVVALENPIYPGAIQTFQGAGAKCVGIPVEEDGVNLGVLESVLAQHRVRLLVLNPTFQNPTGTTLSLEARKRLLDIAARNQVPIVEDHIYGSLRHRGRDLPSLKALDTRGLVMQINSFSKMCFPGLRVGWVTASRPVIERLRVTKQASDLHTDQLAQAALAEFATRGGLRRLLKKSRRHYSAQLRAMESALTEFMPEGVRWQSPEGGMSIWLVLPDGIDAGALLFRAKEKGVVFTPGRYFYFQAPQTNTIRLGYTGLTEKQTRKGVEILAKLIQQEIGQRRRRPAGWAETSRVALV